MELAGPLGHSLRKVNEGMEERVERWRQGGGANTANVPTVNEVRTF